MTNYWEHLDMNLEIQQGKNIADASKVRNTSFVVMSAVYGDEYC